MVTFDKMIIRLIKFPSLHAKFVNSLSLLEYMGARKILKSQPEKTISLTLLSHAAEEIRHAQTFKRLALKMSNGELNSYSDEHLLCGKNARNYMQAIDHGIASELSNNTSWINYLLTTLLVEERAGVMYPHYDSILTELGFPGALQGIVREEVAHLEQIRTDLNKIESITSQQLDRLREIEAALFSSWMQSIELVYSE